MLTRLQRHHQATLDRTKANKQKPPTRRQAKAWLAPIDKCINEMLTGEVDAIRGYAVTRLHTGDDYARIDYCINGFVAMMVRLMPEFDVKPMQVLAKKLANGIPLEVSELHEAKNRIKACEDQLIKFKRADLINAALTEQIAIELEQAGIKEAA